MNIQSTPHFGAIAHVGSFLTSDATADKVNAVQKARKHYDALNPTIIIPRVTDAEGDAKKVDLYAATQKHAKRYAKGHQEYRAEMNGIIVKESLGEVSTRKTEQLRHAAKEKLDALVDRLVAKTVPTEVNADDSLLDKQPNFIIMPPLAGSNNYLFIHQ